MEKATSWIANLMGAVIIIAAIIQGVESSMAPDGVTRATNIVEQSSDE